MDSLCAFDLFVKEKNTQAEAYATGGASRVLQIIHNHESEAHRNGNPRNPAQQIRALAFGNVRGSPVGHQSAEQIARNKPAKVREIVGCSSSQETQDRNINKPANQSAAQGLSLKALPALRCSEQYTDEAQQ